jgi:hypothetical protein
LVTLFVDKTFDSPQVQTTAIAMASFNKQESFKADANVDITPEELAKVKSAFTTLDNDNNGYITTDELSDMLAQCEISVSEAELPNVMAELDLDGSGHINFDEFMTYYAGMKSGKTGDGIAGKMMKRTTGFLKVEGAGGASHMFSEEEKVKATVTEIAAPVTLSLNFSRTFSSFSFRALQYFMLFIF